MLRTVAIVLTALFVTNGIQAQENRMTPELLWKLGRLGSVAVSPDGNTVAYAVRHYELAENSGTSKIHLMDRQSGETKVIAEELKSASALQWVEGPQGLRLFYAANEDDSTQAWSYDPAAEEATQITDYESDVANLKVSPTGTHLALTINVKMDSTVNEMFPDLPKADARIIDSLMFRHWNAWHDYKYSHIHVAEIDDSGMAGEPRDLMKGLKADCPLPPFGGSEQFAWSPDGKELAYTVKIANNWAESTDSDIYLIDVAGGPARCITHGMNGYDTEPFYSPDGRYLAFHSMERPSFEADRNRIMLLERANGTISELTVGLDQTAHSGQWAPDSQSVLFVSEFRGTNQIFQTSLRDRRTVQRTHGWFNWNLVTAMPDGHGLIASRQNMIRPYEIYSVAASGEATKLTGINDEIYAGLELPTIKERWVRASDGKMIHNWVIYPPDFDEEKQWPMLTYCQGGPQGQIGQWFSYRWNFHLMAANGYVITAVNRRGLPGFGRAWNDQISRDWGGQAMQDILAATDEMVAEPYIDAKRVAAIGASFGGYTVFWLMGNAEDRFCTMIAHCGVFNLESMYGSTEELFFVNWDLGGPYWKSDQIQRDYNRFSPHRFVGNWRTPLLVIHGERDFRVPVTQGMEAFTAAQVQGVPSRFLYYPTEGHWVLSPQNGVLWHRVFFDWLKKHCGDN